MGLCSNCGRYHIPLVAKKPDAEADAAIKRFNDDLLPLMTAVDGSVASINAVLIAMFDHPDTGTVIANFERMRKVIQERLENFRVNPKATPTIRLLSNAMLLKYY
jgi:hypothetical protein